MVRDVSRRGQQIGSKDDVDLIRERASDAFHMLGFERRGQHHYDAIAGPLRVTHERYANACSVRASTSVPAAASSAAVNSSGL
jgi:hypothetical protein